MPYANVRLSQDGVRAAVAECKAGRAQGKVVITMAGCQDAEEGKEAAAAGGEEAKVEMPAAVAVQVESEAVHADAEADAEADAGAVKDDQGQKEKCLTEAEQKAVASHGDVAGTFQEE